MDWPGVYILKKNSSIVKIYGSQTNIWLLIFMNTINDTNSRESVSGIFAFRKIVFLDVPWASTCHARRLLFTFKNIYCANYTVPSSVKMLHLLFNSVRNNSGIILQISGVVFFVSQVACEYCIDGFFNVSSLECKKVLIHYSTSKDVL